MILYTVLNKPIKVRNTHHYGGSLTKYDLMPVPEILIIEEDTKETHGFFLNRYTKKEKFCGDTWHSDVRQAKKQAEFEYSESVSEWQEVPGEIVDPIKYVLELINKN